LLLSVFGYFHGVAQFHSHCRGYYSHTDFAAVTGVTKRGKNRFVFQEDLPDASWRYSAGMMRIAVSGKTTAEAFTYYV
jgi:hypothetical protein